MRCRCGSLAILFAAGMLCAATATAQDSPSLGDAARQARQFKQQRDAEAGKDKAPAAKPAPGSQTPSKNGQAGDATPQPPKAGKKVITNDEIPEHVGPTVAPNPYQNAGNNYPQPNNQDQSAPAEYWKNQITALKNNIVAMQGSIKSLEDSIHYAANCVANCVQSNEREQQKQAQVEAMKAALDQQQKYLEQIQEMARKQGFGGAVYDP